MAFLIATLDGTVYVDTAFINAVQHKDPSFNLVHVGFGEFVLETDVGTVLFQRTPAVEIPNQSGRCHYCSGPKEAIQMMLDSMKDPG